MPKQWLGSKRVVDEPGAARSGSQEVGQSRDTDGRHAEEPQGRIRVRSDRCGKVLEAWEDEAGKVGWYRAGTKTKG